VQGGAQGYAGVFASRIVALWGGLEDIACWRCTADLDAVEASGDWMETDRYELVEMPSFPLSSLTFPTTTLKELFLSYSKKVPLRGAQIDTYYEANVSRHVFTAET
jgi:hypothetical protein